MRQRGDMGSGLEGQPEKRQDIGPQNASKAASQQGQSREEAPYIC